MRFTNKALRDTCKRVGGDPVRKLSPSDRLIGPARLCVQKGLTPAYICVGAAGAIYEYLKENEREQTVENAAKALSELSGVEAGDPLQASILSYYGLFAGGKSIAFIRRAAQKAKAAGNLDVV